MDTKDLLSLAISITSACISIASVIIARVALSRQREAQMWVTNYDLLNRARGMLIADPSLLSLLGIDPNEVIKDGITPSELIYIEASMDASSAMHRVSGKQLTLTEYRKHFIRNQKVRIAWKKYLRDKTFSPSLFTKAVDDYIAKFESCEGASRK